MTINFGTWQDRDYKKIPAAAWGSRVNWHQQRLIEEKYKDPRACPADEAVIFHQRARDLVRAENNLELPLGVAVADQA